MGLFLVLLVAACVAGHGDGAHEHEHHHHDEVEHVREARGAESIPVHDKRAQRATDAPKKVPAPSTAAESATSEFLRKSVLEWRASDTSVRWTQVEQGGSDR